MTYEPNSNDPALAPYDRMPLSRAFGLTAYDARVLRASAEARTEPVFKARDEFLLAVVEAQHEEIARRLGVAVAT